MAASTSSKVQDAQVRADECANSSDWLGAAEIYTQALESLPAGTEVGVTARVRKDLARAIFRAAFQAPTHEEYVNRIRRAEETQDTIVELYQKAGTTGLVMAAMARRLFFDYWLKETAAEKRTALQKCISISIEASNQLHGDDFIQAREEVYQDILLYIAETCQMDYEWAYLQNLFQKAADVEEQAISELNQVGGNQQLVEALYNAFTIALSQFDFGYRTEEARERAKKLASLIADADKTDSTDRGHTLARLVTCRETMTFQGDYSKSLAYAREALARAEKTRDTFLTAEALNSVMFAAWYGLWTEESLESRRKLFDTVIVSFPIALKNYNVSSYGAGLGAVHSTCADTYVSFATSGGVAPEEKRVYLRKGVEIARETANFQEYSILSLYYLSKALYFLALTEPNPKSKRELLEEALPLREQAVRETDRVFPHSQIRGWARNYLALIKAELSTISQNPPEKIDLLRSAIADQKLCVELTEGRTPSEMSVLFRYLEWYGDILARFYGISKEDESARKAIEVYNESIAYLRKLERVAAIPALHWKIARIQDALGNFREASQTFQTAAEEYDLGFEKLPSFEETFKDLSQYMKAWSLIEAAKVHHAEDSFLLSSQNYSKAAETLTNTKGWGYLSKHYVACSLFEVGENLSRQENAEAAVESFKKAASAFHEARPELGTGQNDYSKLPEGEESANWIRIAEGRERLSSARADLEEAVVLDKKGDEEASAAKYHSASNLFKGLMGQTTSEQSQREVETLTLFSEAWAKMKDAEASASPDLYAEAAALFTKIEKTAIRKRPRLSTLADAAICRALEHSTEFRRTRNTQLYSKIKKELETATDYYQQAGLKNAADWARGTGNLFDALVCMTDATSERESARKSEYYRLAEKHLQLSAKLYDRAGYSTRKSEVLKHLERVREEKELLLAPLDALAESPAITSPIIAPVLLVRDQAVGLERFEAANIVGRVNVPKVEIPVGSDFTVELELANVGKTSATLLKLENVIVDGIEIDREKVGHRIDNNGLDMKGERLDYLKTHDIKVPLKAKRKGVFQLGPRVLFLDENGSHRSFEFGNTSITVKELGISGWLKGPK